MKLLIIIIPVCLSLLSVHHAVEFNRKFVGVWFEPWVLDGTTFSDSFFMDSDLAPMISTVSSRFSKVLLRELTYAPDLLGTYTRLPLAIAKYNRGDRKGLPPMEVGLTYSPDMQQGDIDPNFDAVKTLADQTNGIFDGTVSTIYLRWGHSLDAAGLETLTKSLRHARASAGGVYYKLGVYFEGECKADSFMAQLLDHVDIILMARWSKSSEFELPIESAVGLVTRDLIKCKTDLSGLNKKGVRIQMFVDRADTPPPGVGGGVQNFENLVYFWERMDHWASSSNTSLWLFEAFNNYHGKPHPDWKRMGWWAAHLNSDGEVTYEEKVDLIPRKDSAIPRNEEKPQKNNHRGSGSSGTSVTTVVIAVVIGLLVLGIVGAGMYFMYRKIMSKMRSECLSREELSEFFEGRRTPAEHTLANSSSKDVTYKPYNKDLELKDFKIDENKVLGTGAFGVVLHGMLVPPGAEEVKVAVKMVKTGCPSNALKGLLYEVKVLDYVGKHENIVGLVGAYTADLHKGKIMVFYELCQKGSLESHLRNFGSEGRRRSRYSKSPRLTQKRADVDVESSSGVQRGSSTLVQLAELSSSSSPPQPPINPSELLRWSLEIASGMEFLASKHVVHADLATRNVLLSDNNFTAKICDFGLSRRLYDYTNYVKKHEEPLPWRWMAPESLRRLEFNEKTDMWAYGITLWEIYTLGDNQWKKYFVGGDNPYPGMSWNLNFPKRLEQGLRLDQPRYASDFIFEVMTKCWDWMPQDRPHFKDVTTMLKVQQNVSNHST